MGLDATFPLTKDDRSHVWGDIYEVVLGASSIILRSIRIYEGGVNSLHSHPVEETMLIESGVVRCYWGESAISLRCRDLRRGESINIPPGLLHRIEYVDGDFDEEGVSFAQITEVARGEIKGGDYLITRASSAKTVVKARR